MGIREAAPAVAAFMLALGEIWRLVDHKSRVSEIGDAVRRAADLLERVEAELAEVDQGEHAAMFKAVPMFRSQLESVRRELYLANLH